MGDRISDDDLRRLIGAATPGPWLAANNPGDWGLAGAWSITPPNGNPCEWDQCIAQIEYTTPYCAGASKEELDAAEVAKANAALISLAPALAAEVLQLREAIRSAVCEYENSREDAADVSNEMYRILGAVLTVHAVSTRGQSNG